MLVVAAAVALLTSQAPASPDVSQRLSTSPEVAQRLTIREEWRFDRFGARLELGPARADRLGLGWKLAAGATEALDGVGTVLLMRRARELGVNMSWPRGEMNPLLRPIEQRSAIAFVLVKAGFGYLKVRALERIERRRGAAEARKGARFATAFTGGLAAVSFMGLAAAR